MTTNTTSHISFSELKQWVQCAFYHKLIRVDKISGFRGNEYTAFGTAIHTVCEKKLLQETVDTDFFIKEFQKNISELDDFEFPEKKMSEFIDQGKKIIPEIDDALKEYFTEYEVVAVEQDLMEPIDESYNFKGFIDAVLKTPDGKYHIVDWKTCSWGWNARRRSDPMVTYQLTFYKYFYAKKFNIDPKNIETHFALLKRTAKTNHVEFFRVTSGPKKTENALKLLQKALYNIKNKRYIKNRLSCERCEFYQTEHCP
tara:strand:+ start:38871 stop:39638 length:768 start_codon:yes stop_codon:yes gene_type:complete